MDSDHKPTSIAEVKVLKPRADYRNNLKPVKGYTFEDEQGKPNLDFAKLLSSFSSTGFQATQLNEASDIVNCMLEERRKPFKPDETIEDECIRPRTGCTIFLAYTSNLISSGIRENIKFLVKHKMIDCLITTVGGIEEDLIRCLRLMNEGSTDAKKANTYVGDFPLSGSLLPNNDNLQVPSENYCSFQDWLMPILDKMLDEQKQSDGKIVWSPSKFIERLGVEIDHEDSVCYWASKNKIPIFCTAITDGSLGNMFYFNAFRARELIFDTVSDIERLNLFAHNTHEARTGLIILGGQFDNTFMNNGPDYRVHINTAPEYPGIESVGSELVESVEAGARAVKVTCDPCITFPLLVASTFFSSLSKTKPSAKVKSTSSRARNKASTLQGCSKQTNDTDVSQPKSRNTNLKQQSTITKSRTTNPKPAIDETIKTAVPNVNQKPPRKRPAASGSSGRGKKNQRIPSEVTSEYLGANTSPQFVAQQQQQPNNVQPAFFVTQNIATMEPTVTYSNGNNNNNPYLISPTNDNNNSDCNPNVPNDQIYPTTSSVINNNNDQSSILQPKLEHTPPPLISVLQNQSIHDNQDYYESIRSPFTADQLSADMIGTDTGPVSADDIVPTIGFDSFLCHADNQTDLFC